MNLTVFDADNHLYETEDALTRHLPPEHRNLFRYVEINGRKKLVVRDRLTEFIPNPTFEVIAAPGSHMAFFGATTPRARRCASSRASRSCARRPFVNRSRASPRSTSRGSACTLIFPTLASLVEERLIDSPVLTQVAIRAFNEWLARPVDASTTGAASSRPRS